MTDQPPPLVQGERPGRLRRTLDAVERAGNRLPDPVTLFIISIAILMVASALLAASGVGAFNPADGQPIAAVSLIAPDQLRRLFTELPQIFTGFPPLGIVLIMMIGVGIAERAGLFAAALGGLVRVVPKALLSFTIVFAGCNASIASDSGFVVLIPLGAAVFAAAGRHPIAGLSAGFAGVAGGFTANLSITTLDGLLSGMTQAAAQLLDKTYVVDITANWYLMVALVPVLSITGTLICEWIVEPRLNAGPKWIDAAPRDGGFDWRIPTVHAQAMKLLLALPGDATEARQAIVDNLREVLRRKLGAGQAG